MTSFVITIISVNFQLKQLSVKFLPLTISYSCSIPISSLVDSLDMPPSANHSITDDLAMPPSANHSITDDLAMPPSANHSITDDLDIPPSANHSNTDDDAPEVPPSQPQYYYDDAPEVPPSATMVLLMMILTCHPQATTVFLMILTCHPRITTVLLMTLPEVPPSTITNNSAVKKSNVPLTFDF